MSMTSLKADLRLVRDERAQRGAAIRERRLAHHLSVNRLAELSGRARATINKAEAGIATEETILALEEFFDTHDLATGKDSAAEAMSATQPFDVSSLLEEDVIEVEVTGPSTSKDWHVVYRSHPDQVDLVTEQVAKLLRKVERGD